MSEPLSDEEILQVFEWAAERLVKIAKLHAAATAALGWIDEIYPPEIFDGSSGDDGPVRIVAIRENLRRALAQEPTP